MRFMRKDPMVEAVQWFHDVKHPAVDVAGPAIYRKGPFFYVSGMSVYSNHLERDANGDATGRTVEQLYKLAGDFWLSYEPEQEPTQEEREVSGKGFSPVWVSFKSKEVGQPDYWRKLLHFSMFKVNGEKSERTLNESDPVDALRNEDYWICVQKLMGLGAMRVVPYGLFKTMNGDIKGRRVIYPGDYIIDHGAGRYEVMDKEVFEQQFEGVAHVQ